jgi:hypothetical protein
MPRAAAKARGSVSSSSSLQRSSSSLSSSLRWESVLEMASSALSAYMREYFACRRLRGSVTELRNSVRNSNEAGSGTRSSTFIPHARTSSACLDWMNSRAS